VNVELFRDDDRGYVAWLSANASGYVLNIQRALTPSDARAPGVVLHDHGDAAARQEVDRVVREGMLFVAAGTGRLGARARQVRRHPVRHLPAASSVTS
jgi:hypothetical protein